MFNLFTGSIFSGSVDNFGRKFEKNKVKGASLTEVERTIVWMPGLEFKYRTDSIV